MAKNLQGYQVQKFEQLQKAKQSENDVKSRRKIQEEELLKFRMFQVAKWDIVRAKEKEMTAHLRMLQDKNRRLQRCIAHVYVHKIGAKLIRNFQAL